MAARVFCVPVKLRARDGLGVRNRKLSGACACVSRNAPVATVPEPQTEVQQISEKTACTCYQIKEYEMGGDL
jgi:hypothetical protein